MARKRHTFIFQEGSAMMTSCSSAEIAKQRQFSGKHIFLVYLRRIHIQDSLQSPANPRYTGLSCQGLGFQGWVPLLWTTSAIDPSSDTQILDAHPLAMKQEPKESCSTRTYCYLRMHYPSIWSGPWGRVGTSSLRFLSLPQKIWVVSPQGTFQILHSS